MRKRRDFTETETSSVRIAKQRNAFARAELEDKLRLLENEKASIVAKYQRRADALDKRMEEIGYTRSMPLLLLNMIHLQRRMTAHDVSMNIANCYLMHQEKNMEKMRTAAEGSGEGAKELDRQALRHARFIRNAFEEAYNIEADPGWTYPYDRSADIYEYGRTGHDLHCLSVKDAPVGVKTGAYPEFKTVNVAAYDGKKVEGPGRSRPVPENVQSPALPQSEGLLPQLAMGAPKQPSAETQPAKEALPVRPPPKVRPRLTLYMSKRYVRKKRPDMLQELQ